MKTQVDSLLSASWVVPVVPEGTLFNDYSLAISKGKIIDLLPSKDAKQKYQADLEQDLPNHVLMPGLINAHCHAAMSLFRGFGDDMALMTWLEKRIWPAEAQFVNEQFVADGTKLAIAEMLLSGTTCFADMYFFPNIVARALQETDIRGVVGLIALDFPTIWASNADEYISKGLELHDELKNSNIVSTMFAPHAPYTVSDEPLKKILTYANELQIPIQTHLHETAFEVQDAIAKQGQSPLQRFNDLGLLSPDFMAVHMTQLNDDDIAQVAAANAHVVHCPSSNLKLASGFSPIQKLHEAEVNVALGTDGAASNNDLDMFSEMKLAALLAKGVAQHAEALPAAKALSMATINGAKALGIADKTGSLEINKQADIIAVDMQHCHAQPIYDPISHLVYSTQSQQVTHSWVSGKHLMRDRTLLTIDQEDCLQKAQQWQAQIQAMTS